MLYIPELHANSVLLQRFRLKECKVRWLSSFVERKKDMLKGLTSINLKKLTICFCLKTINYNKIKYLHCFPGRVPNWKACLLFAFGQHRIIIAANQNPIIFVANFRHNIRILVAVENMCVWIKDVFCILDAVHVRPARLEHGKRCKCAEDTDAF